MPDVERYELVLIASNGFRYLPTVDCSRRIHLLILIGAAACAGCSASANTTTTAPPIAHEGLDAAAPRVDGGKPKSEPPRVAIVRSANGAKAITFWCEPPIASEGFKITMKCRYNRVTVEHEKALTPTEFAAGEQRVRDVAKKDARELWSDCPHNDAEAKAYETYQGWPSGTVALWLQACQNKSVDQLIAYEKQVNHVAERTCTISAFASSMVFEQISRDTYQYAQIRGACGGGTETDTLFRSKPDSELWNYREAFTASPNAPAMFVDCGRDYANDFNGDAPARVSSSALGCDYLKPDGLFAY
jgi:hypothetical protein